jgi:hypothetical protein
MAAQIQPPQCLKLGHAVSSRQRPAVLTLADITVATLPQTVQILVARTDIPYRRLGRKSSRIAHTSADVVIPHAHTVMIMGAVPIRTVIPVG